MTEINLLTRKDFVSNQMVRWCPGCGDYAILAQLQRILPDMGLPKEDIVFISGIGCSSRFPYYMDTYGIHSIHGRAPTLATGLKLANPNLQVWVITGDGDGLSIGGNHLLHVLRRNVDLNIILFNNRIYGLTKGQYSPTSLPGAKTKSSPMGSIEPSFNPLSVAIGAEATFVARTVAANVKHMAEMFKRAAAHKGTSFVEVYQNCVIFNNGTWDYASDPKTKHDHTIELEDGKPLIFGKDKDKGIRLNGLDPEVVSLDAVAESELLVHHESAPTASLAYLLSRMRHPEFPEPIGVFRCVETPSYEREVMAQIETAVQQKGRGDLRSLYYAADTWEVQTEANGRETQFGRGKNTLPGGTDEEYMGVMFRNEATSDPYGLSTETLAALNPPMPLTASVDISLKAAIGKLQALNVGLMALIEDTGKLAGVFTEGDIFRKLNCDAQELETAMVKDYMTAPVTTLKKDNTIADALYLMSIHKFRHILIVDEEGNPAGALSFRSVARYLEKYQI